MKKSTWLLLVLQLILPYAALEITALIMTGTSSVNIYTTSYMFLYSYVPAVTNGVCIGLFVSVFHLAVFMAGTLLPTMIGSFAGMSLPWLGVIALFVVIDQGQMAERGIGA